MEETWLVGVCLKNEGKQAECVDLGQSRVSEGWHWVEDGQPPLTQRLRQASLYLDYDLRALLSLHNLFLESALSPTQGMGPE